MQDIEALESGSDNTPTSAMPSEGFVRMKLLQVEIKDELRTGPPDRIIDPQCAVNIKDRVENPGEIDSS